MPPRSITSARIVRSRPTIPKRGASMSLIWRSRSSGWPVTRTWSGALRPSAATEAGMSCTTPSVSMHHPGEPLRRHVGQACEQGREQPRALVAVLGVRHVDEARLDVGERAEAALQLGAHRVGHGRPVAQGLGAGAVDDDRHDVLHRLAILATRDGLAMASSTSARARARRIAVRPRARTPARRRSRRDRRRPAPTPGAPAGVKLRLSWAREPPDAGFAYWPSRSSRAGTWT